MVVNPKDIWKLLDDVDHHARAITAKHSELRSMIAQINFPKDDGAYKCSCGLSFKSQDRLDQHQRNVHGEGKPAPLTPHEEQAV